MKYIEPGQESDVIHFWMENEAFDLDEAEDLLEQLTAAIAAVKTREHPPAPAALFFDHKKAKIVSREAFMKLDPADRLTIAEISATYEEHKRGVGNQLSLFGHETDLDTATHLKLWIDGALEYYETGNCNGL